MDPAPRPSLSRGSLLRLMSLMGRLLAGTATAVVTSRALGPSPKGTLTSLLFVAAIASSVASLGIGDASIIVSRGDRGLLQRCASVALLPVGVAIVLTSCGFLVVAALADWQGIVGAVAAGVAVIVVSTVGYVHRSILNALDRFSFTAGVAMVQAVIALVATIALVSVFDLGVLGGVLGALAGAAVTMAAFLVRLRREGLHLRPSTDVALVTDLVRVGWVVEGTYVMGALAERLDLLIVYSIGSPAEAGIYSVALAIGRLPAYVASAIDSTTFPRLAESDDDSAATLLSASVRVSIAASIVSATGLAVVVPFVVPALFGAGFRDAVVPAVLLAASSIAFAPLLLLGRAAAARGQRAVYTTSTLVSLVVMIVLDLLLVPEHGADGAAVASVVSTVVAAVVASFAMHRAGAVDVRRLVPRAADFAWLATVVRNVGGTRERLDEKGAG